jgi:hypothetical protein
MRRANAVDSKSPPVKAGLLANMNAWKAMADPTSAALVLSVRAATQEPTKFAAN